MKSTCKDIKIIKAQLIKKNNICIYNKINQNIFKTKRFFIISEKKNTTRGEHAHIKCNQFIICILGKINIICDDGKNKKKFIIYNFNKSIFIPKGIWTTIKYLDKNNIINVLCDFDYTEKDYIRNYKEFIEYRKKR